MSPRHFRGGKGLAILGFLKRLFCRETDSGMEMSEVTWELTEVTPASRDTPTPDLAVWGNSVPQTAGGLGSPFPGSQKGRACSNPLLADGRVKDRPAAGA